MSSPTSWRTDVRYEATAAHLRRVLRGFSPSYDSTQLSQRVYEFPVDLSTLPLAVLAREVMVIFGAENLSKEDRIRWRYGFTVDGVPCVLARTERYIQLYLDGAVGDDDAAQQLAQRVLDKLAAAQQVFNKSVIQPQLDGQIKAGNVTIFNQYGSLRIGYEYFREGAELAYSGSGRFDHRGHLADMVIGRGSTEGWWNTLAMVSAYFSILEHVLIGCLPFTSFDPMTEDLVRVIGAKWNEKMKRVVDITNPESKRQFDALHDIAERFRNTYSHGAFGSKVEQRCPSTFPTSAAPSRLPSASSACAPSWCSFRG
jgi:hypothetical protein